MFGCIVCAIMSELNASRAPVVLGIILFALVTILLLVPRVISTEASSSASSAPEQPVEIGGISIPEGDGTLMCSNPSKFTDRSRVWECGETRIMARTERTPDDQANALARVYRGAMWARSVDLESVEHPRDGVWAKRSDETGERSLAVVSVADGTTTRFFSIGGPDAHDLAERLVAAVPAEDAKEAQ